MSGCMVTPMRPEKACSGKCKGGGSGCSKPPQVLVVAACEGMVSLFEKQADGHIANYADIENAVFPSMEAFQAALTKADANHALDQLIIVGAKGDIAWMHASLPTAIAKHIAAEIEYPLMTGWFKKPSHLAHALERVFMG